MGGSKGLFDFVVALSCDKEVVVMLVSGFQTSSSRSDSRTKLQSLFLADNVTATTTFIICKLFHPTFIIRTECLHVLSQRFDTTAHLSRHSTQCTVPRDNSG
jgi:hypothetical protein